MKKLILVGLFLVLSTVALHGQGSHEYSPLVEKTVNYKNWTLNDLANNKATDLRSLMTGKKLVMVLYFAPWCPNWKNEAPVAASLYDKYKAQGFEIVGVSEYGPRDDVKNFFGPNGAPYPVVTESESRDDRDKTPHYSYRQLTGDTRKWGSPWNITRFRSEEHTSELQSQSNLVCRLLLEKKNNSHIRIADGSSTSYAFPHLAYIYHINRLPNSIPPHSSN